MTARHEPTFEALYAIAALIEVHERDWKAAWSELLDTSCGPAAGWEARLRRSCAALNAVIEPHVAEIARATGNSLSTVRSVFEPTSQLDVWFGSNPKLAPAEFLRKVARHRSFNLHAWRQKERHEELQLLAAKAAAGGPLMEAFEAAHLIAAGGVPIVPSRGLERSSSGVASPLEQALFRLGVLRLYRPEDLQRWERLAAQGSRLRLDLVGLPAALYPERSIAFVAHAPGPREDLQLVFWPAGYAANHQRRVAWEGDDVHEQDAPPAPRA